MTHDKTPRSARCGRHDARPSPEPCATSASMPSGAGARSRGGGGGGGGGGGLYNAKAVQLLAKLQSVTTAKYAVAAEAATRAVTGASGLGKAGAAKGAEASARDAKICQDALAGLCVLSRKASAKSLIVEAVSAPLVASFRRFREFRATLQSACDLVWSLAYHDPRVQNLFAERGVTMAVLECAKANAYATTLLKSAFGALSSLCRSSLNQEVVRKAEGMALISLVLGQMGHGDKLLLQYALDASASVCHAHKSNVADFLRRNGLRQVLDALGAHVENPSIVRSACIVLVVLRDRPGGSKAIAAAHAVPVLIKAIETHVIVPELEHILCALLGQLMREVANTTVQIVECGAVPAALAVIKANPHEPFIIEACCLILLGCCKGTYSPAFEASLVEAFANNEWSQVLDVALGTDERVSNPIRISTLRVAAQISSVAKAAVAETLLPRLAQVFALVYRVQQEAGLGTQADSALEVILQSKASSPIVAGCDVWVAMRLTGGAEEPLRVFDAVQAVQHKIRFLHHWHETSNTLTDDFVQAVVRGGLQRLRHLEVDRSENLHRKDPRQFLQVRAIFALVSACLLNRIEVSSSSVGPSSGRGRAGTGHPERLVLDREGVWSEVASVALSWLRETRAVDALKSNDVRTACLHSALSLLQFLNVSLHKERQLTLRSMASNGGVTLVLQIQKHVRSLSVASQASAGHQRMQTAIVRATETVLKVIGAGTCPAFPVAPSLDSIRQSFDGLLQEELAKAAERERQREENLQRKREEEEQRRQLEERQREGKQEAGEVPKDWDAESKTQVDSTDEEKQVSREEEEDNVEDEDEEDNNDDSDADESEDETEGKEALDREEDLTSNSFTGGDVRQNIPEADDEDDAEAECKRNDRRTDGAKASSCCSTSSFSSVESKNNSNNNSLEEAQALGVGEIMMFLSSSTQSTLAAPGFVVQMGPMPDDYCETRLEPYIPLAQRVNPSAAETLARLSEYKQRRLVYDWIQAKGAGSGRAASTISPVLPYTLDSMSPMQSEETSVFFPMLNKPKLPGVLCDDFLHFDSRFESGNLLQAIRVGPREYDLVIRSDLHTRSHHQWFFFAVSNTHGANVLGKVEYKFNVVNMTKPSSMFSEGMQPVLYSVSEGGNAANPRGWRRAGSNVAYFGNNFAQPQSVSSGKKGSAVSTYNTLSFTMPFGKPKDTYLVAMCYPYTYSMLQHFLATQCEPSARNDKIVKRGLLCSSLGGLRCDELTITDFSAPASEVARRPAVVLTARVHPGEVVASFMMEGTIRFLLGDSVLARTLRSLYYFKIVPMLNPDGVFHGNSRTSLAGCDLNRTWVNPSSRAHPTIWNTKQLIKRLHATRKVALYVDFHGHSRKKNIFLYGVEYKKARKQHPQQDLDCSTIVNPVRRYPQLVAESEYSAHIFSLPDCSYRVSGSHSQAARVVVARELGVRASFTLEASFCGGGPGTLQDRLHESHFNPKHYESIGLGLCDALLHMNHFRLYHELIKVCKTTALATAQLDTASLAQVLHPAPEVGEVGRSKNASPPVALPGSLRRSNSDLHHASTKQAKRLQQSFEDFKATSRQAPSKSRLSLTPAHAQLFKVGGAQAGVKLASKPVIKPRKSSSSTASGAARATTRSRKSRKARGAAHFPKIK